MADDDSAPTVEVTVESESETEVEEVAEAVAEAVAEVAEAVADAVADGSGGNDESLAFTVGTLVADCANFALRLDNIESRLEATSVQAEIATDIASIALTEVDEQATEPLPQPEPEVIQEDEPPPTKRSTFGKWFFGE
jgi:hypothetical protein